MIGETATHPAPDPITNARAALRARQGAGARYDAAEAPAETLGWARHGTAYFARLLNELPDTGLGAPSLLPRWRRAHVIAHVGYQARGLARLMEGVRAGTSQPMHVDETGRLAEIENAATLPPHALRHLFRHSAVHLDVEWRDLAGPAWDTPLALPDGTAIPASRTPWLRARAIWIAAVDLDAGGSFIDFPPEFIDRLLAEAVQTWPGPGIGLAATDRGTATALAGGGMPVRGKAADLARWITGRGARRLSHDLPLPDVPSDPTFET